MRSRKQARKCGNLLASSLCLAVVFLRPKGRASASARGPEVQRGMRGRQARRARVRHAAEASMAPPAASPTCRRWRADGLLWTDPRTAPILRWLLCRGGGERPAEASVVGSARGGDERRKPVSPSGANYTGQLRGGQATIRPCIPTARTRRRRPSRPSSMPSRREISRTRIFPTHHE